MVAEVGFHGPPDGDGWVEIGYRVVAGYRRRGFAEEACRGLLDWALARGVAGVRAAIGRDSRPWRRWRRNLTRPSGSASHEVLGGRLIFECPRRSYMLGRSADRSPNTARPGGARCADSFNCRRAIEEAAPSASRLSSRHW